LVHLPFDAGTCARVGEPWQLLPDDVAEVRVWTSEDGEQELDRVGGVQLSAALGTLPDTLFLWPREQRPDLLERVGRLSLLAPGDGNDQERECERDEAAFPCGSHGNLLAKSRRLTVTPGAGVVVEGVVVVPCCSSQVRQRVPASSRWIRLPIGSTGPS